LAVDLTFPVREATVAFLRAQLSLTALIPAGKIFGQMQPPNTPYPFVRFGGPGATPLEYSCQNGSTVAGDLHIFAENEAEAEVIGTELVLVLDGMHIDLDGGGNMDVRWIGAQSLRDPDEADIWHKIESFEFEAGL
jgi:hypothetical protein